MKPITVDVGVTVHDEHNRGALTKRHYTADVEVNIVGLGIASYGPLSAYRKQVTVLIPDWAVYSEKWTWPMTRPGYPKHAPEDGICCVVCRTPAKITEDLEDQSRHIDLDALVQLAISGGFAFYYPNELGGWESIPVDIASTTTGSTDENPWTLRDASAAWGISVQRVHLLIKQGRVEGAQLIDDFNRQIWVMPAGTPKPENKTPGRSGET